MSLTKPIQPWSVGDIAHIKGKPKAIVKVVKIFSSEMVYVELDGVDLPILVGNERIEK